MCCPQGQLEKSKPSVKEVTERPSHGQELNPTSKMLWELEVTADIEYAVLPFQRLWKGSTEYGVKIWK